ncbi:MAG: ComEC/Rec2 family competence protein [Chitinophagales bacterium]|nr:ComEC/Rec2 family competence protein [Bacteroidota bacterium]MCB9043437.1 ComEC/Rec2 family competence protein [Chitinophagales bacterium]
MKKIPHIHAIPALRLLLLWVAGILLAYFFPVKIPSILPFLLLVTGIIFYFFTRKMRTKAVLAAQTLFFSVLIVISASWHFYQSQSIHQVSHFLHWAKPEAMASLRLLAPPEEKEKTYQCLVAVKTVEAADDLMHSTTGKAYVYLPKDSTSALLRYGDIIQAQVNFKTLDAPANEGQFDYRQYLAWQNIYAQSFIRQGKWQPLGEREVHWAWQKLYALQRHLQRILQQQVASEDALAVASALLLGSKKYLSDEMVSVYAQTGAMHVLAVSGLHVGIVSQALLWFLSLFLGKTRRGKYWKVGLVVAGTFLFAAVTGFSPSVLRASLMFSMLAVAQVFRRQYLSLNIVGASALILLMFNPLLLFQLGFQLSYAAVLGIMFLQQPLANLWHTRYKALKFIRDLTAVSVAAQIATLPLSLYYFHQFPVFFWASNFVVIPLASVILYLGLSLFFVGSFSATLGAFFGKILEGVILVMNKALVFISDLPFSLIFPINVSVPQVLILYASCIFLGIFLIDKKMRALQIALVGVLIFSISYQINQWHLLQQNTWAIVHLPNKTAIVHTHQGQASIIADSSVLATPHLLASYLASKGVQKTEAIPLTSTDSLQKVAYAYPWLVTTHDTLLLVDENFSRKNLRFDFQPDKILLCGKSKVYADEVLEQLHPKELIIDGATPEWLAKKWMIAAANRSIPVFYTTTAGMYKFDR